MRFQKPHEVSAKEAIFISVEQDDTTDTYVLGDLALWKLADDNLVVGFQSDGHNTQCSRVEHAIDAAGVRAAGFVAGLPVDNNTASNVNQFKHATEFFELQVYGFNEDALADNAVINSGVIVECGSIAGTIQAISGAEGVQVGVAFTAYMANARDGTILIKGLI